jgi:hypothetical protein
VKRLISSWGFKSPYWERIENLSRYGYLTVADILILCDLFHCSPRDFTLPVRTKKTQPELMQAYLTERRENGKIVYEAYSQQSGHEGDVLYKITEDDPGSYDVVLRQEEITEAYKIITQLFETGYFDEPKDALQIFRKCCDQSQLQLRPRFINAALQEYLSAEGNPRLIHPNERGKYDHLALAYQKIHQEEK